MPLLTDPRDNQLLCALPEEVWSLWSNYLEPVDLPMGKVLCDSGRCFSHVFFPTSGIVSLLYVMADGHSSEVAVAGKEGLIGVPLLMGGDSMPTQAVVQTAGEGYRLKAQWVTDAFNRGGPTMRLLLRYVQALMAQLSQLAVCNRHHTLDQQLCRWLLLSLDRLEGNQVLMTQEVIANMLGVRREGVTEAAGKLQRSGLIHYRRGHITVLDRDGLEHRSCECYRVVRSEYERLLPGMAMA
ncbi:MAG: Crp/Fnr family transcriptional regulator [Burkholderiales bacterium]